MERVMTTLIVSGAGLSADSGVPVFRGFGGWYDGRRPEDVLSAETWRRTPDLVEAFHDELRSAIRAAMPNAAHLGIARYAQAQSDVLVATQNVDDLLERAGCPAVLHLHGQIERWRCSNNPHHGALAPRSRCGMCGARSRTDTVLFGEQAPAYTELRRAIRRLRPSDQVLVIGTRGTVLPLAKWLAPRRTRRALLNLEPSAALPEALFEQVWYGRAAVRWAEAETWLTQ
jgi:NAD-dependent deacetylase